LGMVAFAGIVFRKGTSGLDKEMPTAANVNLMSAVVTLCLGALLSDVNATIIPQDIPALLLFNVGVGLQDTIRCGKRLRNTLLACVWISSMAFGAVSWLTGYFRVGQGLRSIPTPVVGGFIAATGASAVLCGFGKLLFTSLHVPRAGEPHKDYSKLADPATWLHFMAGLLSYMCIGYLGSWIKGQNCMRGVPASVKALVGPFCTVLPMMIFYVVLTCTGDFSGNLEQLRDMGWVNQQEDTKAFYKLWTETYPRDHLFLVQWPALLQSDVLLNLAVLQCLSLLSAVLNIIGLSKELPDCEAIDIDKELRSLGKINLVVGALGGTVCFPMLGMSKNMLVDGGTHRLAQLVGAAFVGAIFVSGFPVSPYVPNFFLGAFFLLIGIGFIKGYLVDKFWHIDCASYCTMLVIVVISVVRDMHYAIIVGLLLEAAVVIVLCSSADPIVSHYSTDSVLSSQMRSQKERKFLTTSGLIHTVNLQGPLFFGIAPKMMAGLQAIFQKARLRSGASSFHLIIDLTRVTSLDDSAVAVLISVSKLATGGKEAIISFVGAEEWKWLLARSGLQLKESAGLAKLARERSVASADIDSFRKRAAMRSASAHNLRCSLHDHDEGDGRQTVNWYRYLDEALIHCEDDVLSFAFPAPKPLGRGATSMSRSASMIATPSMMATPGSYHSEMTHEQWQLLLGLGEELEIAQGQEICTGQTPATGVYVIERGFVKRGSRSDSLNYAPTLAGTTAFVLGLSQNPETVVVESSDGATVFFFSKQCLADMRRENQESYIAFMELCARHLCAMSGRFQIME